jgi:hypothetical protein
MQFKNKIITAAAILITIILLALVPLISKGGITGHAIDESRYASPSQELEWNITTPQERTLTITPHADASDLKTLKLSGYITGEGSARIYLLDDDGNRHLILDERAVSENAARENIADQRDVSEDTSEESEDISEAPAFSKLTAASVVLVVRQNVAKQIRKKKI